MAAHAGSIEAPYTIASLSSPLDRERGRIQASAVAEIKRSRKRKRHEVAIGVDGEGVNIYNVQSHSLIASYALPPQSYLCCPPCSIHSRLHTPTVARRSTYATIKDGYHSSKRRLLSFTEDASNRNDRTEELSGPERRECKLREGEILSLEAVQSSPDEQRSVMVNYTDGGVGFVSHDLSQAHWQDPPALKDNDVYMVEHSALVDIESAKKGILKSREDVVALLDQSTTPGSSDVLMCRIVRSSRARHVEIYAVHDPMKSAVQTSQSALQLITNYELPAGAQFSTRSAEYQLHAETGILHQLLDDTLKIFDLSGTLPKLVLNLGEGSKPIHNFTAVSSNSVVAFSKGTATVFEASFGSIQGSVSFEAIKFGAKTKKRKRDEVDQSTTLRAVSAFTDIGLIVAIVDDQLAAFQLGDNMRESRNSRHRGTLLSSVVSNGAARTALESSARKWEKWTAKVDALIADDDIESLERLVANDSSLGRQRKQKHRQSSHERDEVQNGDAEVYEDLWPLPETYDPSNLDVRKARFILSKIFSRDYAQGDRLKIRLESVKLLEWLALTGLLTASELRTAHQANLDSTAISDQASKPGAIMNAIRQVDGDFQVIRDLLSLPVHWEAEEVVQALRHVIQSFDALPTEERVLALPAPPSASDEADLPNGDIDHDLDSESRAVEEELDLAMNTLSTGLEVRSDTVQLITKRLHAFPSSTVTTVMREMMSHSETIFFIHILRIELADGGWTSQYVDLGDSKIQDGMVNTIGIDEERGRPSDHAIKAIGDLLNCAVDAIGTSGWLVGQSGSANGADALIDALRAEVSAGLEGCYEASTLETLLVELDKCYALSEKASAGPRVHGITEGYPMDLENSFLPLGPKVGSQLVPGRNSKPSQKKTKMAIGREKSRQVGKYSFERIRV